MNVLTLPTSAPAIRRWSAQLRTIRQLSRFETPDGARVVLGRQGGQSIALVGRAPSVLCLHGFCGVPIEMMDAGEAARSLGLAVRAPLLPGHGGHPETLRDLRYGDWLAAARAEFQDLRQHGPVFVIGMSMGSLLAMDLALEFPDDVAGLGAIANALWLKSGFPGAALRLVELLRLPDFGAPTKHTRDATTREPVYNVQPVHAALSVVQAARRIRPQLGSIQCPTLVVHGARDQLCPVDNAWRFAEAVGSENTEVTILPRSDHMIPYGTETAVVRRNVQGFLERVGLGAEAPFPEHAGSAIAAE